MTKSSDSQKNLLFLLLIVVIFFAAYQFGYQPVVQETLEIESENTLLESRLTLLQTKAGDEELYHSIQLANDEAIDQIIADFGAEVSPEKSILFVLDLCSRTGMEISSISFGEDTLLYTGVQLTGEEGVPLREYSRSLTVSYTVTYEGLKRCLAYINEYFEKMNVSSLSAAYDSRSAMLSGTMTIDWFSVTGTEKTYVFEDLPAVDIGNGNIFRSGREGGN